MPITAGASLVRSDAKVLSKDTTATATVAHGVPVALIAYVHTTSETSPFIRAYTGTVTTVASLARAVTRTLTVSNPPAALLVKDARTNLLATSPTVATLVTLKAHFTNLSASVVTVATSGITKAVTVVSGFLSSLPPAWVSVGTNATVVSRRTPSLLATVGQTGTLTKGATHTVAAAATAVGTATRQAVAHLAGILATETVVATLAQMPLRSFLASQPQTAAARIGYPRTVTSTQAQQALLAWIYLPSVTPVLNPLDPTSLTLIPSEGATGLFPGGFYPGRRYPGGGLVLTVNPDGTLTLEPL